MDCEYWIRTAGCFFVLPPGAYVHEAILFHYRYRRIRQSEHVRIWVIWVKFSGRLVPQITVLTLPNHRDCDRIAPTFKEVHPKQEVSYYVPLLLRFVAVGNTALHVLFRQCSIPFR